MMKKQKLAILTVLLLLVVSSYGRARQTITPFGRPRAVKFDNHKGRLYTYYCLNKGQSTGFAAEGPAKITIRSRAGLTGDHKRAEFQLQVWEDKYLIAAKKFKSKAIDAEMKNSGLIPGASREIGFDVPAGIHNYRLWLVSDNLDTLFIRIYKESLSPGKPVNQKISLLDYQRQVHLYSKKNQTPYYLVDKKNGIAIQVTGPVDLAIRCRANFTNSMDGRIGYTLSILENNKEIKTLSATTSKSLTMAYQDYAGIVPSKPTLFVFSVPAGAHIYTLKLKESEAETISVRLSLPEKVK